MRVAVAETKILYIAQLQDQNSAHNSTVPLIPPQDPIYKETKYLDNNTTLQI